MALLQVEHLCKTFGALRANDDISFSVDRHQLIGIIGPNGAGKSTLFNCIAGHHPLTSGRILFDGKDVTGYQAHQMARAGLARTFQVYAASGDLSALENVMVGCFLRTRSRLRARRQAFDILADLHLEHLADRQLSEIPVAYQKLIAAATAIATRPKLLLLDEVAAGLNPSEIEGIMASIRHIHDDLGITVILIEHVMALVMGICDRLIVLDSGKKIAEGEPRQIAKDPEVIRAYLGERYVREQGLGE